MTARTKSYLTILIVFVVGVIVGALIGIHRPNDITFVIRANGEVNLRPYAGDVIHWVNEDPSVSGTQPLPTANVSFHDKSAAGIPCKETPTPSSPPGTYSTPRCTVTTMPLEYFYDCENPKNHRACQDPGVGPGSSSGPHTNLKNTLEDVFHQPESGERNPGSNMPTAAQPPDGVIQCNVQEPTKPQVTSINYTANSGAAIEWSSSVQGYSFDLSQAQPTGLVCSGSGESTGFSSSLPYATCTLPTGTAAIPYSYTVTVTDSKCPGTATGTINVNREQ